jgi:hypothetical protein
VARSRVVAAEIASGVAAREGIERDEAGEGMARAAGFVEADVTGAADAEKLKIDAAGGADGGFVGGAVGVDLGFGDGAGRQVRALRVDVDVVKEVAAHERAVALGMLGRERVVFVEVKRGDVGEAQAFLAVEADEFGVDAHGRGTGGEAEHDGFLFSLALADEGGNFRGDGTGGI